MVGQWGLLQLKIIFFAVFKTFSYFSKKLFAECFFTHDKLFAVYPIKGSWQKTSLPMFVCRVRHTAKVFIRTW